MNIIQITPGAGRMYCGNCFRDNALVAALRQLGHDTLMVPLYLPLTLDEENQSAGTPIFFSGVNVYLAQKFPWFRHAPGWLHRGLAAPRLLQWAAGRAAKTRAEQAGELTLSMLRGEEGHQARELEELIAWLKTQPRPDVICLSNVLLAGLVRRLKAALGAPVVCLLQGEDSFLDSLPEAQRAAAWELLARRAAEADLFVTPSRYFAGVMGQRLRLPPGRIHVIFNGLNLAGYPDRPRTDPTSARPAPCLGFFARMCPQKGLDLLVEAFLLLKQRGRVKDLKLRVGGGCGPGDAPFVNRLRAQLAAAGVAADTAFHPNLDRPAKLELLQALTVFSVPARGGEAFGLYLLEAMAAGVPVVQPRVAAFPELLEATGGGLLCQPADPLSLAETVEALLQQPDQGRAMGEAGRQAVREKFSAVQMARAMARAFAEAGGQA